MVLKLCPQTASSNASCQPLSHTRSKCCMYVCLSTTTQLKLTPLETAANATALKNLGFERMVCTSKLSRTCQKLAYQPIVSRLCSANTALFFVQDLDESSTSHQPPATSVYCSIFTLHTLSFIHHASYRHTYIKKTTRLLLVAWRH